MYFYTTGMKGYKTLTIKIFNHPTLIVAMEFLFYVIIFKFIKCNNL